MNSRNDRTQELRLNSLEEKLDLLAEKVSKLSDDICNSDRNSCRGKADSIKNSFFEENAEDQSNSNEHFSDTPPFVKERGKELKKVIDDVLCSFDFEKVHSVMQFLGWRWAFPKSGGPSVPTVSEIRKEARRLLEMAVECAEKKPFDFNRNSSNDPHELTRSETVSSGGLEVFFEETSYGFMFAEVNFVIEAFSSDNR